MPRYEVRNTSNNARSIVEGENPQDLMRSVPAGTYRPRVMAAQESTDIVVPQLTAAIAQTSLEVGNLATLTTNAPVGAEYQWRLGGVDISGATSPTYLVANTGSLTCVVSIPGNPQPPVETAAVTVGGLSLAPTAMVTSVTDPLTGHVYTFNKLVQAGQYWNGEWFVVADPTAQITSVSPVGVNIAGQITNGLVRNPFQNNATTSQGWDNRTLAQSGADRGPIGYDAALNIDPDITGLEVPVTEGSYVKAESYASAPGDSAIRAYSVLTVVPSVPLANAFRPGIRAASKVLAKTTANIDWSLRRNIPGFQPVADLTSGIANLKRLQWTWRAGNEPARGYGPGDGIGVYGASWGDSLGGRMLAFHGDYSQAQLEETVHAIVQIGIDLIAGAQDGLNWSMEEGHHIFRKFPALMAALLLDDADMKAAVNFNLAPAAFGNDDNAHYYITQTLIDNSPTPNSGTNYPLPYTQDQLGMPEWGSAVATNSSDGSATAELRARYRVLNGLRHINGIAWVYATAGAEALCNPAMLDYGDRLVEILDGHYVSGLYSTQLNPMGPSTNWDSTPFGATRGANYNLLRAFSARPRFINVPEEMGAPTLTANANGTVGVAINANAFLSPRNSVSAIQSYQLRWRPITNLTGTTTPDASIPWQVITGISSLPYTLTGVPGNTQIRVQLRAVNTRGVGVWHDAAGEWVDGLTNDIWAARVTTHNTNTAPQAVRAPVAQLAILGEGEIATCNPGIWVGNPSAVTLSYQWQRSTNGTDWSNISGATSQTYTTVSADVGNQIRCAVTGTNTTGATTVNTGARAISASPATTFQPAMTAANFRPIWHYASRVLQGDGFVQGSVGGTAVIPGEDGAIRLNEIGGANFDNVADVEILMEYELSGVNNATAQIILRGGGDTVRAQGYRLGYVRTSTASSTDIAIDRMDNGVATRIATFDIGGAGTPANTRRSLRVRAEGTTLRVKEWATASAEPGTWRLEVTDATHASGFIGSRIPGQTFTRIYRFDVAPIPAVATVPAAFVDANWSVATGAAGALNVTLDTLPANGGATITDVEYDLDASNTWVSSGGTGNFTILGLTPSTSYAVRLRAVNSVGPALPGNSESATTGAAAAGITHIETFNTTTFIGGTNVSRTLTFTQTLQEGDMIIISRGRDVNTADSWAFPAISGTTARQVRYSGGSTGSIQVDYLFAGSTPPTEITIPYVSGSQPTTIRVDVFRGVDPSNPFSVSDSLAAGTLINSLAAPAITPAHSDCYIYSVALYNDREPAISAYPTNLTDIRGFVVGGNGTTTNSGSLAAAGALLSGGANVEFSPGTWSWNTASPEEIKVIVMALRPA